jgi:hypothetical protein
VTLNPGAAPAEAQGFRRNAQTKVARAVNTPATADRMIGN